MTSPWALSWRADPRALPLADRHYSRGTVGAPQFGRPCRDLVLLTPCARALWMTIKPLPQYVRHAWPGAWIAGADLASLAPKFSLAVAAARKRAAETADTEVSP